MFVDLRVFINDNDVWVFREIAEEWNANPIGGSATWLDAAQAMATTGLAKRCAEYRQDQAETKGVAGTLE